MSRDSWPQVELIWSYMIFLHFLRLLRLDPIVLHVLSVLWKLLPDNTNPVVTFVERLA